MQLTSRTSPERVLARFSHSLIISFGSQDTVYVMPTDEDPVALEAARVQKDRAAADEELDAYLRAPCESRSLTGGTLVQFWDVSYNSVSFESQTSNIAEA